MYSIIFKKRTGKGAGPFTVRMYNYSVQQDERPFSCLCVKITSKKGRPFSCRQLQLYVRIIMYIIVNSDTKRLYV